MPSKSQPKFYQLLLRTHRLTICLTAPQSATVASLKQEALSALLAQELEGIPKVKNVNDFQICRAKREKNRSATLSEQPEYEVLSGVVKDARLINWEVLFLQFLDENGNPLPIESTQPSLYEEDEVPTLDMNKGKRKAPPE